MRKMLILMLVIVVAVVNVADAAFKTDKRPARKLLQTP